MVVLRAAGRAFCGGVDIKVPPSPGPVPTLFPLPDMTSHLLLPLCILTCFAPLAAGMDMPSSHPVANPSPALAPRASLQQGFIPVPAAVEASFSHSTSPLIPSFLTGCRGGRGRQGLGLQGHALAAAAEPAD